MVLIDNMDDYYDPKIKEARLKRLGDVPFVKMDIRDVDAIEKRCSTDFPIKRVLRIMAAMANVRYSVGRERLYAEVNTIGCRST